MNKRTQISLVIGSAMFAFGAVQAQAAQLEVTVTNATKGIYFTPILAAAHDSSLFMFRTGRQLLLSWNPWRKAETSRDYLV